MKRGEVWWVNFNPSIGGEIRKVRPAIIISNDSANKSLNRLQVVPVTSKIDKVFPSEALITLEGKTMKAIADQISTASKPGFDSDGHIQLHKSPQTLEIVSFDPCFSGKHVGKRLVNMLLTIFW